MEKVKYFLDVCESESFLLPFLALQPTLAKNEPPVVQFQAEDNVLKPAMSPEVEKAPPPEPKKRTNRKASITNTGSDVESTFDLKQSFLPETKKNHKGMDQEKSVMKDLNIENNATHLERHKKDDSKVDKTRQVEMEEVPRALGVMEKISSDRKSEGVHGKLVNVNHTVNQSERVLEDTVLEQKRQPAVCQVEGNEPEGMQPAREKPSNQKMDIVNKPELRQEGEEGKPIKLEETVVSKTPRQQEEKFPANKAELGETEGEPLKVPLRSKGKVAAEKDSLKSYVEKPKETIFQPSVHGSEEPKTQRCNGTQVSSETMREKELATKQSFVQTENHMEQEAKTAPPRPPVRVKSKSKGRVERQCSRDTETDQDDQQVARIALKTSDDRSVKKGMEEKPGTGGDVSAIDAVAGKQPVRASETDVSAQYFKQSVRPMKKEHEQEIKVVVEPMRREEKVAARTAEEVPLLYISEDEAFSEALTDIPAANTEDQPPVPMAGGLTRPSDVPRLHAPQDERPEFDISAEEEPQLQEAAVKIQAAFKGYKTRRDMRPVFSEVFKNQSVELHGTATLVCVLEGKPSTVRWLRNGQPITGDHRCQVKATEGGVNTLTIKNLTSSDAGVYTCEAANKFGITSYNGNLTVVQTQKQAQKAEHPPLAAITPLQLASQEQSPNAPQNEDQVPTAEPSSYVESVSVSLWEAYNLTEQQDAPLVSLRERRGSSLIASSSRKHS